MRKELSLIDRIGGPWQIMRALSILIVIGLLITQSMDIYAYFNDLIYVPRDYITLSWRGVDNPNLLFYILEFEETPLISHGLFKRGYTLMGSYKTLQTTIRIPLQDKHSYKFRIRAVFSDSSVSEPLEHESLFICELPPGYVSETPLVGEKPTSEGGKLRLLESIDIYDSENIRPVISDLDNDGLEDLLIGKKDGTVDFYRRLTINGSKKLDFDYPQLLLSDNQPLDVGNNASPFFYDYNDDGFKDLFVGDQDGEVILYTNLGSEGIPRFDGGVVVKSISEDPNLGLFVTICIADWNNDGSYDLITGNDEGYVNLYLNNGNNISPDFTRFEPVMVSNEELVLNSYTQPLVYDWNGDGKKDLLVADSTGTINLFLNEGKDSEPIFTEKKSVLKIDGIPTVSVSKTGRSFKILVGSQDGFINFYN